MPKKITASVKEHSVRNVFESAGTIAERALYSMGDANLPPQSRPKLANLIRIANRTREKLRPEEPKIMRLQPSRRILATRISASRHLLRWTAPLGIRQSRSTRLASRCKHMVRGRNIQSCPASVRPVIFHTRIPWKSTKTGSTRFCANEPAPDFGLRQSVFYYFGKNTSKSSSSNNRGGL